MSQNTLNADQRRGNRHIPLSSGIYHFFSITKSHLLVSKVLINKGETQHSLAITSEYKFVFKQVQIKNWDFILDLGKDI